jgi:hypothetical protein
MRRFRIRPNYANVVATVALFIALGGTALATHPGGQNTISTADIQDGQVKTDDIGNGEVKVADIGQGAVATDEIANGQVKAAEIGDGEVKAAEIATDAVNAAEIATGAVRTAEIANGQVQAEDLAPGVAPGTNGARAYARVMADAFAPCTGGPFGDECTFDHARGVASVFRSQGDPTGVYCVEAPGISPGSVPAAVTVDWSTTSSPEGNASAMTRVDDTTTFCPPGAFEVITHRHGQTPEGLPSNANTADDVGFTIVIP